MAVARSQLAWSGCESPPSICQLSSSLRLTLSMHSSSGLAVTTLPARRTT